LGESLYYQSWLCGTVWFYLIYPSGSTDIGISGFFNTDLHWCGFEQSIELFRSALWEIHIWFINYFTIVIAFCEDWLSGLLNSKREVKGYKSESDCEDDNPDEDCSQSGGEAALNNAGLALNNASDDNFAQSYRQN
jgi:hypothetical protein